MSSTNIQNSLKKLFDKHRLVFWYDDKKELQDEFEALPEVGFTKVRVNNNQFEVKHRMVKLEPDTNFLLYFESDRPENKDNWLLDLELANHLFHTDQEAMFLQELGLDYYLKQLVADHIDFFKAKSRRSKLKELLEPGDEQNAIRKKMLAVVFNVDYVDWKSYIQADGKAFVENDDRYEKELKRFNLYDYYWDAIKNRFNYESDAPSIYDFLLEVFHNNFSMGKNTNLTQESKLLLTQWQDSSQYRDSYMELSERIYSDINVEELMDDATLDTVINDNLFRKNEFKIIRDLNDLLLKNEISLNKLLQYIKQRENKFWYNSVKHFYASLEYAAEMLNLVQRYAGKTFKDFEDGIESYQKELYEVDKMYRKFIWNYRETNQSSNLSELAEKIEKVYSNDWLLGINDNWQKMVNDLKVWPTNRGWSQQQFFKQHVQPIIARNQRLFVIISDALRYECGVELNRRILGEDRFVSEIEPMVSSLPSYTQLGMASLLPHKELSFKEGSDSIAVDGMMSNGTAGRTKILETNSGVSATAINAEEFMVMNRQEGREYVKQYDLIYIYHNRIDKVGDDKTSEDKMFDAVEQEIQYLIDIVSRIGRSLNGYNMMITSDHGFIYQHSQLHESDFTISGHTGDIWKENRRFVIGKELQGDKSTQQFDGSQLNIASSVDVLIPKSVNRIRVKGAGSKFVHGGASLQEVVVPLLKIGIKKEETTSNVDVDIIKSADRITTNLHVVSFIQQGLVSEQVLPRTMKAGIYADDGALISDTFRYLFDIDEGSERQREVKHTFTMNKSAASKYRNQRVRLVLEEPIEGTERWKQYKEYSYTLNISFINDFDF